MTGYQRALQTFRREQTDCVASWGGWIVSADFFEYITGKPFWDDPRGNAIEAYRKLEVDILLQSIYLPDRPDEWRTHTTEVIEGAEKFKAVEDVIAYVEALPDPKALEGDFDLDAQCAAVEKAHRHFQEDELGGEIFGLPSCNCVRFTWYSEFGYESYLTTLALYPETMRKLFEHSAAGARLANSVRAQLVKDRKLPPVFFTGQDICGQRGPMISPTALRSLYYPNLRYALEPLVEVDADIIWHSDGYIIPMVDDLISCGVSGFQGFQEETGFHVGEIAQRRVRNGRKPILLAGLSVARALPHGTPTDVAAEVERIVREAGAGGGLAVGTANTAGPDCPNENLKALYRCVHRCS